MLGFKLTDPASIVLQFVVDVVWCCHVYWIPLISFADRPVHKVVPCCTSSLPPSHISTSMTIMHLVKSCKRSFTALKYQDIPRYSKTFRDLPRSSKILIVIPFQDQLHLPQRKARQRNGGLQEFTGLVACGQLHRHLQRPRDGVHQLPQKVSFILQKYECNSCNSCNTPRIFCRMLAG